MIDPKVFGTGEIHTRQLRAMSKSQMRKMGIKVQSQVAKRKCLLKSCDKETTHPGGYCCAEHCKEDK